METGACRPMQTMTAASTAVKDKAFDELLSLDSRVATGACADTAGRHRQQASGLSN